MHILVTNDDGPPSPQSSPYVHCLVKHLQEAGHVVSVCLPHTQRSWIGKAHMIGQTLKPTYYRPSSNIHGEDSEGSTHHRPSTTGDAEEWILIDGTPASCVQIGLHHFFQDRGPIDLVVSGPNYGRNTTAVFALSSGTLGAALEAAVCRQRSIALSFAFFTRNHDPVIIEAACRHSVKVIEALAKQWPTDGSADLYSVNVPLVEGVENHKTLWTEMLQNYWKQGSCFQEIDGSAEDEAREEEKIREGPGGEVDDKERPQEESRGHKHKHFKWAPRFTDVYQSVEEAAPGNDGWAVKEGHTSVTPLKAGFLQTQGISQMKELELTSAKAAQSSDATTGVATSQQCITAVVQYDDEYVQPLILDAFKDVFPDGRVKVVDQLPESAGLSQLCTGKDDKVVQVTSYETIDFELAASNPASYLINSYMIRKALIRKHFLTTTVDHWVAKNPESVLKQHVKRSEAFELDYAEFLDDALIEAFDLRESMDRNEEKDGAEGREWWILKPGMSDRGQGIKLFSTMDELQAIFDVWEEERPDSDDEDEEDTAQDSTRDYITTSHLRHFVAQPYIHPPLLVDYHKFHIRTYVLCTGSLSVHVYQPMLALFAAKPYVAPWTSSTDIETFLTNTCLQDSPNANSVRLLSSLPLSSELLDSVKKQIGQISGELFEGAARAMPVHFQTLPNAFEAYGLDFMIDEAGNTWLLEVNAFPDFKQTGGDLREVVAGFWRGVVRLGVKGWLDGTEKVEQEDRDWVKVKEIDLGRR
ncbi:sure-like protein [Sarocladium strictum]